MTISNARYNEGYSYAVTLSDYVINESLCKLGEKYKAIIAKSLIHNSLLPIIKKMLSEENIPTKNRAGLNLFKTRVILSDYSNSELIKHYDNEESYLRGCLDGITAVLVSEGIQEEQVSDIIASSQKQTIKIIQKIAASSFIKARAEPEEKRIMLNYLKDSLSSVTT